LGSSASPTGDKRRIDSLDFALLQAKEESKNDGRWRLSMLQKANEVSAMLQEERLADVAKASEQISELNAVLKLEREKHRREVDVALAEKQTAQDEFQTREADLRQRLDDKDSMMAEVLKQAGDSEERLESQRRAFEQQAEKTAAQNAKLQQQLNRMGEDSSAKVQRSDDKDNMMAEVLKQARDCEERLENQRRAFEEQVEKAAAENAQLQQQMSRMGEDSSAKEQQMAAVLKQIEATHSKRREEISERMQHKPRFWKNASEDSSTDVSEGSSTPGSCRSSNFSSPVSVCQRLAAANPSNSAQSLSTRMKGQLETIDKEQQVSAAANRKVENEELQRRLERLREHRAKEQAGNEQLQK